MDHRMNEESAKKSCELLQMTSEKVQETTSKLVEVDAEICQARDALMKLDEELNYMETCNDRHKQSQGIMLERMTKETAHFQEQTARLHDAELQIGTLEKEQDALRLEIDGLRCSSEEQMTRKTQLQAEIGALGRHMGCITNTNRELSVELESFVAADAEVQSYLSKKQRVDHIKQKAEEELRVTLADAHARKEEVHRTAVVASQYMSAQAAIERNEHIER